EVGRGCSMRTSASGVEAVFRKDLSASGAGRNSFVSRTGTQATGIEIPVAQAWYRIRRNDIERTGEQRIAGGTEGYPFLPCLSGFCLSLRTPPFLVLL